MARKLFSHRALIVHNRGSDEAGWLQLFGSGENIAAGNSTVDATMKQWLSSPGHCANIMSRNFTEIGIGYDYGASSTYKHYWCRTGKPL